jgi:hypothetical protein
MAPYGKFDDHLAMQVVHARSTSRPDTRLSLVSGVVIGLMLIGLGAALGYLAIATPFAERFMPEARAGTVAMIMGTLGRILLLAAPAIACIAGFAWLGEVAERGLAIRRRPHPITGLRRILGPDYAAATGIRLPDGKTVAEVIVGPHGIAVFEPLPQPEFMRQLKGSWELRIGKNHWVPMENPLDRAARTADSVRHWLGSEDRDFVVKVHVAVITPDVTLQRTSSCAVIARDQVPAYLASLPAQRSFTTERRAQVFDLLRSAA